MRFLSQLTIHLALCFVVSIRTQAVEYDIPPSYSRVIGENMHHRVNSGEDLADVADRYGVVYLSLLSANHNIDPFALRENTSLLIPRKLILPDVEREGIVINLPELRLYYFQPELNKVHVFPIGIGRIGRSTPTMDSMIAEKRAFPDWMPTDNVKKEYWEEKGIRLPDVVPSGPDNPLGTHALRLGSPTGLYSIHGTNQTFGIGLRVSSGCIRMRPKDIEWLFDQVTKGEKVKIIDKPVKLAFEPDGSVFVEVHRPLSRTISESQSKIISMPDPYISSWLAENYQSDRRYLAALALQTGVPTEIGYR